VQLAAVQLAAVQLAAVQLAAVQLALQLAAVLIPMVPHLAASAHPPLPHPPLPPHQPLPLLYHFRDDSGHGSAAEILRVHGGTADMLDGWSCSCFSQLHGHLGMFVSPSGSRFRRFSSVMANLGVPPLHHTVLTTGYAVTEHSAATTILLTQLSGTM
jgi:hypothetical protein